MPFFKWKAYDSDIKYTTEALYKYHTGVTECDQFEMVVLELAEQDLVAKEIIQIEYDEYARTRSVDAKLEKYRSRFVKRDCPKTKLARPSTPWAGMLIGLLVLIIIFLVILQCCRH